MKYPLVAEKPSFAFALNKNASRVSNDVKKVIHSYLPEAEVYISNDFEEAENHIKSIIKNQYKYIFTGGGDGTTYHFLNLIRKHGNKNLSDYPSIGLLGLGTGNGLASEVNAHNLEYVLGRIKGGYLHQTKKYNLIETEEHLVHFSTLGLDAQILNDFIDVKEEHPFLKRKGMGLPAYLYAYFSKSMYCDALNNKPWEIQIINEGDEVYKINSDREPELLTMKKGKVIYDGYANLAGVGTATNYGFKFKVFPYARAKKDFMNLRVINLSNSEFLSNWYSLWTGKYKNENILKDFLVKKVRIKFSKPAPFQFGGDAKGFRDEIVYEVSDHKVNLLDFSEL